MRSRITEMLLLYLSFYLPAVFSRSPEPGMLTVYMLQYILIAAPQALLLLHIVHLRGSLVRFGLVRFKASDLLSSLFLFVALLLAFSLLAIMIYLAPATIRGTFESGYRWQLPGLSSLPLALLFCLTTGFREELFFRAYLLTRFEELGLAFPLAAASSSVLFSVGHVYQGVGGILFSLLHGFIFASAFVKQRNLGVIALAHALYNFTLLFLSTYLSR